MDIISFFSLTFLFKILLLVLIGGYAIFCLVVLSQVRVMNRIINFGFISTVLFYLAIVFVILSLSLFGFALAIL
ncbi:MAG: hypothetical protein KBD46_00450 [Candidatus Levybacteria bacterium]|nr:hypothetical protein [Candidatus Levybacteria bacterium]